MLACVVQIAWQAATSEEVSNCIQTQHFHDVQIADKNLLAAVSGCGKGITPSLGPKASSLLSYVLKTKEGYNFTALLDTGADHSIVNYDVATAYVKRFPKSAKIVPLEKKRKLM